MKGTWNPRRWPAKVQFVLFCCIMLVLAWLMSRLLKDSWTSPREVIFFVELVPYMVLMFWVKVTRSFSFQIRWSVPVLMLVLCVLVSIRAESYVRPFVLVPTERSLEMFVLWYLVFFAVVVAWIVAVPVEESLAKLRGGARINRAAWRLTFALAGVFLIALDAALLRHDLFAAMANQSPSQFVSVCHALFYLAIAFYVLLLARLVFPLALNGREAHPQFPVRWTSS